MKEETFDKLSICYKRDVFRGVVLWEQCAIQQCVFSSISVQSVNVKFGIEHLWKQDVSNDRRKQTSLLRESYGQNKVFTRP